ncbi:hypothetical protein [Croceimicrobium hydrocarbonivorans]|uniref:Outer membrane protein beta-barrel domain-containing protein n=1 Tax=Croceimicrobium hydrocarbonivorans TaxID=2761580 RepID=A0A7H0VHL8_9FLAO|nr:hypothetical protein [Croceimicrobium hydrocarbonivorans]QNR25216.1 hypothetical protein H4K34_05075 [Croceimicrobium hydrocarbonivorans]
MKYLQAFFLTILLSTSLFSQSLKGWQIDLHSGIQTGLNVEDHKNSLVQYDPSLAGFEVGYPSNEFPLLGVFAGISANYELKPYLSLSLNFNQVGLSKDKGTATISNGMGLTVIEQSLDFKSQRLGLDLKIDALYKSPYEELNLILGINGNIIYNRTVSKDIEQDSARFIVLGSTRTMREIRYISFNIGLEWRDYFSEHFGYFLRLKYMPTVNTSTASLLFEHINIDGNTEHPRYGQSIKPGTAGYPAEFFSFDILSFSLGLSYQW